MARDAGKAELANPQAQAALKKAWNRLTARGPYGCPGKENPREKSVVQAEHKASNTKAHFGRGFDMCV